MCFGTPQGILMHMQGAKAFQSKQDERLSARDISATVAALIQIQVDEVKCVIALGKTGSA